MRNFSFSLTTPQFRARIKTVTRRMGWLHAKVGDVVMGVEKGMGLKPGEEIVRLGPTRFIGVRRELLRRMTDDLEYGYRETEAEGFPPGHPLNHPTAFVEFFCRTHKGCTPDTEITRIEFAYLDAPTKE